ncbi:hypothetical protein COX47_01390 [Candidatus Roizmanbacteria bacterium CG23_combo_of_CG06-09_8_20_14_all_35_49]|uniref:N(6)-L-threonylcarbamoyladenine synthase n=1 Tax=Candidatus Roizmanbacteria bacterium CG23_combo_of_CG06-09_8_20_14_all_35_49 TaxID=1974863 RepID=A0A2G9Y7B1_9BACT|nr:MAG: hypothetical protein COX47_01390 [Candidatus Roizmanbacteria bacterium CG23_combo_of_CG06-09_8_20_14_all_35_49]
MKTLGIDTVFNTTASAIVENGNNILIDIAKTNREILPNQMLVLAEFQNQNIGEVIKQAFIKSGLKIKDISLIAVSNECSLRSTVAVGVASANLLSKFFDIPIIGVSHIEAHIFSNWLGRDKSEFESPILVFSSSGASSCLVVIKDLFRFRVISEVDIGKKKPGKNPEFAGVGNLFSFLANNLNLSNKAGCGYLVSEKATGNKGKYSFKVLSRRKAGDLNFFWLKQELIKVIKKERKAGNSFSKQFISDICASFEQSIFNILISDIKFFIDKYRIKEVHLAGGISANNNFFFRAKKKLKDIKVRRPVKKKYSIDNAAMVASRGYFQYQNQKHKFLKQRKVKVVSNLGLEKIAINQL